MTSQEPWSCSAIETASGGKEYWCCPTGAGSFEVAGVPFELGCIRVREEDLEVVKYGVK